jgi:hypothetical protein
LKAFDEDGAVCLKSASKQLIGLRFKRQGLF